LALAAILLLALVSGVLIGCIGVGGVLLVPVLRTRGEIIESGGCEQRKVRITISIWDGGA
jgi:uncharacterized membrane protein YfcA